MSEELVSGEHFSQAAAAPESGEMNAQVAQAQEESKVPLAALQAERAQRQKMEEELRLYRDHLSLLQSRQPAEKPQDEFEGLSDGDVLTVGEFKKLAKSFQSNVQMSVEELRISQKYPDYQETITKYLPEVIKQNPSLQNSLRKSQDFELAYYLAKNSDAYRAENKKTKRNADAERILQNAATPGSLASMGGTTPINSAKQYARMSDEDFRKEVAKNMGYL